MRANRSTKTIAGIAGLLLLAVPLAACGSEDEDSSTGASSSESTGKVEAIASVKVLDKGQDTSVALDAGFLEALTSLGVAPAPFGSAELNGTDLSFPITGGNVSIFEEGSVPNYVIGQVQHEGSGLSLTAGDTEVVVGNFNVDPGVSIAYGDVAVNKEVAATSIPIFRLDGSTLNDPTIDADTGQAVLQGTTVYLTDAAAALLNDTFSVDALTGEIPIGIATITVETK